MKNYKPPLDDYEESKGIDEEKGQIVTVLNMAKPVLGGELEETKGGHRRDLSKIPSMSFEESELNDIEN